MENYPMCNLIVPPKALIEAQGGDYIFAHSNICTGQLVF